MLFVELFIHPLLRYSDLMSPFIFIWFHLGLRLEVSCSSFVSARLFFCSLLSFRDSVIQLQQNLFRNTDINNQPVNLNSGGNNNPCCSGCCQSQLINGSHHGSHPCIAVWINYDLNCLCNLLFLIEYSTRHRCREALTESWGLCVPKRQIFF